MTQKFTANTIILYDNTPYKIVDFNHKKDTVRLLKWLHRIDIPTIRGIGWIAPDKEIPRNDISNCKILLRW